MAVQRVYDQLAQATWLHMDLSIIALLDCHLLMLDNLGPAHFETLLRAMRDPGGHWNALMVHLLTSLLKSEEEQATRQLREELSPECLLKGFQTAARAAKKSTTCARHQCCHQFSCS